MHNPQRIQLLLKMLVYGAYLSILYVVLIRMENQDISLYRLWLALACILSLFLILVVDRIGELSISREGINAKLAEAKLEAITNISTYTDDIEVIENIKKTCA